MKVDKKLLFQWKQGSTYDYCLGIDMAFRKTGIAILDNKYNFIMSDRMEISGSVENLNALSEETTQKFIEILEPYKDILKNSCVVIEHCSTMWKFSLMLGLLSNILTNYFQVKEIRAISANRWQYDLLRKQRYYKREQVKQLSKDYFNQIEVKNKKERMTQDEYDAYCIATWGINKLFNNEENEFEEIVEEEKGEDIE